MDREERITQISRIRVKDLEAFKAIHARAITAQEKFGVDEVVYQSVDDPRSMTVVITGERRALKSWLESPERASLAKLLELEADPVTWQATELRG